MKLIARAPNSSILESDIEKIYFLQNENTSVDYKIYPSNSTVLMYLFSG